MKFTASGPKFTASSRPKFAPGTAAPVSQPEAVETPVPAPFHLSERAKALWVSLVPRRAKSPERLALIQTALEALDRADAARVAIEKDGLTTTTTTTGAIHLHPLLRVERESRQLFAQIWKSLGLEWYAKLDAPRFDPKELTNPWE